MPNNFNIGDLIIIEMAVCKMHNEIDLSTVASQQMQQIIGKCEIQLGELSAASAEQQTLTPTTTAQTTPV